MPNLPPNIHPTSYICFSGTYSAFASFTMSDIQEVAPENSVTDFPKDGVFFRVV